MKADFNHVVIGAADLAATTRVVARPGAPAAGGGPHPLMATHNRLMRLGGQGGYLAVDPAVPPPSRTRWYTLDDAGTAERLSLHPRSLVLGCVGDRYRDGGPGMWL